MATPPMKRNPPMLFPAVQPLYHETYLQARTRLRHTVEHYRRIENVQSLVDDGPPRATVNIRLKLKKLMAEGERLARVEKENKILLKNIIKAMRGHGMVDHYHTRKSMNRSKAMNLEKRTQRVNRINWENRNLLERILNTKTSYDHFEQEMDYQKMIRSRRGRAFVFTLWNELAERRKLYILRGQVLPKGYGDVDMDELRAKFAETHKNCIPSLRWEPFRPEPVPRSNRAPENYSGQADHRRCFTAFHILPPVKHRPPPDPSAEVRLPVHENKALRLRKEESTRKIKALKPKPFHLRSRHLSPGKKVDINQSAAQAQAALPSGDTLTPLPAIKPAADSHPDSQQPPSQTSSREAGSPIGKPKKKKSLSGRESVSGAKSVSPSSSTGNKSERKEQDEEDRSLPSPRSLVEDLSDSQLGGDTSPPPEDEEGQEKLSATERPASDGGDTTAAVTRSPLPAESQTRSESRTPVSAEPSSSKRSFSGSVRTGSELLSASEPSSPRERKSSVGSREGDEEPDDRRRDSPEEIPRSPELDADDLRESPQNASPAIYAQITDDEGRTTDDADELLVSSSEELSSLAASSPRELRPRSEEPTRSPSRSP